MRHEASFHEAAHIVLAHLSQFHLFMNGAILQDDGTGEVIIGLSRSKCARSGKAPDCSARHDPDVAREFAMILCAGLAGEQRAAAHDPSLQPNPDWALNDHRDAKATLAAAGLNETLARHQAAADALLETHWPIVMCVAKQLMLAPLAGNEFAIAELIERMTRNAGPPEKP